MTLNVPAARACGRLSVDFTDSPATPVWAVIGQARERFFTALNWHEVAGIALNAEEAQFLESVAEAAEEWFDYVRACYIEAE